VGVEKLESRKMLRKTLRWDALQTAISIFWTFSIPRFWRVSRETRLFQQARLISTVGLLEPRELGFGLFQDGDVGIGG
jgi:hypothetical protein